MEKLTKTQVPILASYSMPLVLLSAFVINALLVTFQVSGGTLRLLLLAGSFPIGFVFGRLIYTRRSHIEIQFDSSTFRVIKGSKEVVTGFWKSYRMVSLVIDQFGKPNLRLYKTKEGEHVDLPISRTNAEPQRFRDYAQSLVTGQRPRGISPQVAEAS
jgi:hypothetical protein